MRSKLLNPNPPIAYAIVLDTGDEVMGELSSFIREHAVEAASVTAIGAFQRALLGYFEWQTKQYKKIAPLTSRSKFYPFLATLPSLKRNRLCISMPFSEEPMAA